ncbi:hypothetical protein QNN88_10230 [Citrobacter sp. ANG330]|uniref:hypothetical protein n=1 Tax=Citrobacter sp. ANG330 TaxID=3048142 RepID=UPI0039C1F442
MPFVNRPIPFHFHTAGNAATLNDDPAAASRISTSPEHAVSPDLMRSTLLQYLQQLSKDMNIEHPANARLRGKIETFCNKLAESEDDDSPLAQPELLEGAKLMRSISKNVALDDKRYKVSSKLLSQHLHTAWIEKDIAAQREKLVKANAYLAHPGSSTTTTYTVGGNIGTTLRHHPVDLSLQAQYTRSNGVDCDDDGMIETSRDNAFLGGLSSTLRAAKAITARLKGSVTHTRGTKAVSFNCMDEYIDAIGSKTRYTSLHSRLGKKHSVRYFQNKSYNHLDELNKLLTQHIRQPVALSGNRPHQDNTTTKRSSGTAFNGSAGMDVALSPTLTVGAAASYTHENKDIYVNLRASMVEDILTRPGMAFSERLEKVEALYHKPMQHLGFPHDPEFHLVEGKYGYVPAQEIDPETAHQVMNQLSGVIDIYCQAVRGHDAGHPQSTQLKHELEARWGVVGRYGFLQGAEIMLASLADKINVSALAQEQQQEMKNRIREVENKIISPALSYDHKKLDKHVKFNNLLKVELNNKTLNMKFTVAKTLGPNNGIAATGEISVTIKKNITRQPNRLRAGEYKDITFGLDVGVSLNNLPDNSLQLIANQAGIPMPLLKSAIAQNITSHVNLTAGARIMIRFFKPSSERALVADNSHYAHQFTRVSAVVTGSAGVDLSALPVGMTSTVSQSTNRVVFESLGEKTLSYLLVRFGYDKGIWHKGGMQHWENFAFTHKNSMTNIMKEIATPSSHLHAEANTLIEDYQRSASPEEFASLQQKLPDLYKALEHAGDDEEAFSRGIDALHTLFDLQQQETGRIFREGLTQKPFKERHMLMRKEPTVNIFK